MITTLSLGFRLLLWVLITGDLRPLNLLIGVTVALLLPRAHHHREPIAPLVRALGNAVLAIGMAYGEAIALILANGREQCDCTEHKVSRCATPLVIFLELLAITITPFTLVLDLDRLERSSERPQLRYRIHRLRPERNGETP
jgi:multicomponent Na+:H+ antiporter subunit E